MRLLEFKPQLWAAPGRYGQGVLFRCPHCRSAYLAVAFANPVDGGGAWDVGTDEHRFIRPLWDVLMPALAPVGSIIVPPGALWRRSGEMWGTFSLEPSVDASKAGHWHGMVTNGEVS